jgi:hypothetical protein
MKTYDLELKTDVPDKEKGECPTCYWDAWGTADDVQHLNIGTNVIMAYHGFYQKALQSYWMPLQSCHHLHQYHVAAGNECADLVLYVSGTPEHQLTDLLPVSQNYENMMAASVGEFEYTFSIYPTSEIAKLESLYDVRNGSQVNAFVACNAFLIPLLQQIPEQVKKHFGESAHLSLEVIVDQEERNDMELVALVCTNVSPDDAFVRLRSFDRDWWLARLADTRGKLSVHVELQ